MQPSGRISGLTSEPFWFEDPPPGGAPWGALAEPSASARREPEPVLETIEVSCREPQPPAVVRVPAPEAHARHDGIEWERRRPVLPPTETADARDEPAPEIVVRRGEPAAVEAQESVWVLPEVARAYPRLFDHERLELDRPEGKPAWEWEEGWAYVVPRAAQAKAHEGARRSRLRITFRRMRNVGILLLVCMIGTWAAVRRGNASAQGHGRPVVEARMSAYAVQLIPAEYRRIYLSVAREYGLDWSYLAAVGQVESREGQSNARGVHTGTNYAGASGPAQFLSSTWARFGVNVDGHGAASPYDPADAITSMAALLKASGAPQDWPRALYAYNHSSDYVQLVLSVAARLRASTPQ